MPAQVNKESCTGCGDCAEVCPIEDAITVENAKATVKKEECIECNACVDACPSDAVAMGE